MSPFTESTNGVPNFSLFGFLSVRQLEEVCTRRKFTPIIADFLPERAIIALIGDWASGKTPGMVQMGLCAAAGIPFLGHESRKTHVLWLNLEPSVDADENKRSVKCECLCCALEANYSLRKKKSPQFVSHLTRVRESFSGYRAAELTSESIDRFIKEQLEAGKAAATVNRSTQLLRQAFKLALKRKRLGSSPDIERLDESGNVRKGFFSVFEAERVIADLPDYLRDFARFSYLTGRRAGEVLKLRWEHVSRDLVKGDSIKVPGDISKNREPSTIPLVGELCELLTRRLAARTVKTESGTTIADFIFHHEGSPIVDYRKAWHSACVINGLGRFVCR